MALVFVWLAPDLQSARRLTIWARINATTWALRRYFGVRISRFAAVSWADVKFICCCLLEAFPQNLCVPAEQKKKKRLKPNQLHPQLGAVGHWYESNPRPHSQLTPKESCVRPSIENIRWLLCIFSSTFLTWGAGSNRRCGCDRGLRERKKTREKERGVGKEREKRGGSDETFMRRSGWCGQVQWKCKDWTFLQDCGWGDGDKDSHERLGEEVGESGRGDCPKIWRGRM